MNEFKEFFHMGGYAFYVWTSYGITMIVLVLTYIWPIFQKKNILNKFRYLQERQQKLARRQL